MPPKAFFSAAPHSHLIVSFEDSGNGSLNISLRIHEELRKRIGQWTKRWQRLPAFQHLSATLCSKQKRKLSHWIYSNLIWALSNLITRAAGKEPKKENKNLRNYNWALNLKAFWHLNWGSVDRAFVHASPRAPSCHEAGSCPFKGFISWHQGRLIFISISNTG